MALIKIHKLCKKYGGIDVLKDMDLEINEGETLVILGRSGVGKSVLLKHIIGITHPDSGWIEVGGVKVTDLRDEALYQVIHTMWMLFQGGALFDSMNVGENVGFYMTEHSKDHTKWSPEEIKARVQEALTMVALPGVEEKMPSELSGGMKKRAALARLIAYRPKILLYDEPTTGLDPITANQINELIVKTQKELKSTSIVVTHDIVSALFVGDRLALHEDGKIAYIGTPEEFLKIDNPVINFLKKTISQDPRTFREK